VRHPGGAKQERIGGAPLALTALYPPAQLERMTLEGMARVDDLGLDRDTVVEFSGIDLETTYDENAAELDAALNEMRGVLEDVGNDESQRLVSELDAIEQQIMIRRAEVAVPDMTISNPAQPFDRLEVAMADILRLGNGFSGSKSQAVGSEAAQLDALGEVMVSAGAYGDATSLNLLRPDAARRRAVIETRAVHAAMLDQLVEMSDGPSRDWFEVVRSSFSQLTAFDSTVGGADAAENFNDPEVVRASATRLLEHLDYIDLLQVQSDTFGAEVLEQVSARADAAESEVLRTQLLVAVVVILSILLIGRLLWTTLQPLRRLTRQAERITAGELALPPVKVSGARDIRALAITTNEMLSTLRGVEHQINGLAGGDASSVGEAALPGAIGVALRRSVERLADTTMQLHASEQLASAIVAQAADAIWTIDGSGTICSANDACTELTGVGVSAQIGRPLDDSLSGLAGEVQVIGAPRPTKVLVAHSVIDAGETDVIAVIARDVSQRARFEERLAFQARHDDLTSMPNRLAVLEHLDESFRSTDGPVAVLFVDIDGFKSVNDTHGHVKGDWVLTEIAKRLSSNVRSREFVARLGGDEFVVVITGIDDIEVLVNFGERLIRQIEQPYFDGENMFALSASVGVASVTGEGSSIEALRMADSACYLAKRRGRSRVEIFDAELQASIAREADLALALRRSVPNNELVLHLQPIVDLHTGQLAGAEALVRWERPGVGLVPPGDFIPIAERSSLIFDIERWVLKTSCEHVVEWRRQDPTCELRIAVNISGRHLIEGDLVNDLQDAIEATGADPSMLEFELTETQLLEDLDRATEVLDALRDLGVTIAVDDFGTGYSSMTYLRHLPIDSIKIDQSFIARATEEGFDSTVVESLLAIGRTLHLGVVAEGVETESQLDYVRDRGCDRAQGFLLARPMPADLFDAKMFSGEWNTTPARALANIARNDVENSVA
jgi:diguanylate cyclase (GGDEF)-like protein